MCIFPNALRLHVILSNERWPITVMSIKLRRAFEVKPECSVSRYICHLEPTYGSFWPILCAVRPSIAIHIQDSSLNTSSPRCVVLQLAHRCLQFFLARPDHADPWPAIMNLPLLLP